MSTMVRDFVEVSRIGELKHGEMKMELIQVRETLLAKVGDQYYAPDNLCRHMGGNLSKGKLEGTIVTCPRPQYDLKDGHVVRWTTWPSALLALDQFRSKQAITGIFCQSRRR